MDGPIRCAANHVPLTPISFLERAAAVYGDLPAVVFGSGPGATLRTWRETRARCLYLAGALAATGVARGDVVAAVLPNTPEMYELHFGVPMAGAVLCTLNVRHDAAMLSNILAHSEARLLVVDQEHLDIVGDALKILAAAGNKPPITVAVQEPDHASAGDRQDYESFLHSAPSGSFDIRWPEDEEDPIALNYTSGTTSRPKGVIYSHRGAYLNAVATVLLNGMPAMPVYLWTVPMFHCNGWCLAWGVAAQGGTNVCLRRVTAEAIFNSIAEHRVTYMGGAPTVLNMIVNAPASDRKPLPCQVTVMTGGAPPPPEVLFRMEELGFSVIHSYGLTETYGPATVCAWKPEWDGLPPEEKALIKARQGVNHLGIEELDVKDPVTMVSVPADGKTMGEVMFRGNTVMMGYYKDRKATEEAFSSGWLHSGDLGVRQPDGYIQLKDRSKDIVVSGGENISTIEVESVLFSHPAVLEAAVVGRPDDHWGETPCAFVKLKDGQRCSAEELVSYCRARMSHYMVPRSIVFGDLPKTATGKTQKFVLRQRAKAMGSLPRSPAGSKL